MKKVLAGAALATLLFAVAGFAYSARPTAVTPGQFRALQARVAKLEKTTGAIATYTVNCLFKYAGVARFGTPPSSGYVYDTDNNPSNGQFLASALDVTDVGETPTAYFVSTTNTACVSSGLALNRKLEALRETSNASAVLDNMLRVRNALSPYAAK